MKIFHDRNKININKINFKSLIKIMINKINNITNIINIQLMNNFMKEETERFFQ